MQFFRGQNGTRANNHYILKNIKSLHHSTINNIRPLEKGGISTYDDLIHPYNVLNKTMIMPYMSVSLIYDGERRPGGSTAIKYLPIILIDLDFTKKIKKFFIDEKNHNSKLYNYIKKSVDNTKKIIYKSYPYNLVKTSYSGSLHILINYRLLDDNGDIIIDDNGVDIADIDHYRELEKIHKKVYDYFYHIYKTLMSKQDKQVLYLDDNVGGKIAQLMILTYDQKGLYNDMIYDIYSSDINTLKDILNSELDDDFYFKKSDESIIESNNNFVKELINIYKNDDNSDYINKLLREKLIKELSELLSHHNFKWVASLWYLDEIYRKALYYIIKKEDIYKGTSIPLKSFESFNNYIESKHEYHIKRKDHYTIALSSVLKVF